MKGSVGGSKNATAGNEPQFLISRSEPRSAVDDRMSDTSLLGEPRNLYDSLHVYNANVPTVAGDPLSLDLFIFVLQKLHILSEPPDIIFSMSKELFHGLSFRRRPETRC